MSTLQYYVLQFHGKRILTERLNKHKRSFVTVSIDDNRRLTKTYRRRRFSRIERFFDFFFFCYNKGVDRRENAYEELAILMYGAQKMFVCVVRIESLDYIGPGLEQ